MGLLVGDIGGTKVHLALFEERVRVKEEKFTSHHFSDLSAILLRFIDRPIEHASLALAGPIQNRQCKITNLPWVVDAKELEQKHGISHVHLLNDLEAAAWGLSTLGKDEMLTLNAGIKQEGNQVVLAAGTGLGIAGLYWDGKKHHPFATEAGHADFAPRAKREDELRDFLYQKYGHVSIERVVSGLGIEHLYRFLTSRNKSPDALTGDDITKRVVEKGMAGDSPLCEEILDWFASLYGAVAGSVALHYLSIGGVYLAGGIAPKIVKILKQGDFLRAFIDKGRFKELLSHIPVHVVLNEELPLLGAVAYSSQLQM